MTRRGIGGRPAKGPRDLLAVRPPDIFGAYLRARAEDEGMSINDYLLRVLAEAHQMPQFAPEAPRSYDQKELPLRSA